MKCPMCDGKGMVDYPMYADDEHKWQYCVARMKKCDMCHGSGEVDMTNEEWLKQCTTEQLAEFLDRLAYAMWLDKHSEFSKMNCEEVWVEWLKQPHRGGAL